MAPPWGDGLEIAPKTLEAFGHGAKRQQAGRLQPAHQGTRFQEINMKLRDKVPLTSGGELLDGLLQAKMGELVSLAVKAEAESFMASAQGKTCAAAKKPLVAGLSAKERTVLTGVGPVKILTPVIVDPSRCGQIVPFESIIAPRRLKAKLSWGHHLAWTWIQGLGSGTLKE